MLKLAPASPAGAPAANLPSPFARQEGTPEPPWHLGRSSRCTPANGAEICRKLATGGDLSEICREPGAPSYDTIRDWIRK